MRWSDEWLAEYLKIVDKHGVCAYPDELALDLRDARADILRLQEALQGAVGHEAREHGCIGHLSWLQAELNMPMEGESDDSTSHIRM